jgi:hypothetical protein
MRRPRRSGRAPGASRRAAGTNASWAGTVKPNGVSTRTCSAATSTTKQISAEPDIEGVWGGEQPHGHHGEDEAPPTRMPRRDARGPSSALPAARACQRSRPATPGSTGPACRSVSTDPWVIFTLLAFSVDWRSCRGARNLPRRPGAWPRSPRVLRAVQALPRNPLERKPGPARRAGPGLVGGSAGPAGLRQRAARRQCFSRGSRKTSSICEVPPIAVKRKRHHRRAGARQLRSDLAAGVHGRRRLPLGIAVHRPDLERGLDTGDRVHDGDRERRRGRLVEREEAEVGVGAVDADERRLDAGAGREGERRRSQAIRSPRYGSLPATLAAPPVRVQPVRRPLEASAGKQRVVAACQPTAGTAGSGSRCRRACWW